MDKNNWWPEFQKHSAALDNFGEIPIEIHHGLKSAKRLFFFLKNKKNALQSIPHGDLHSILQQIETLSAEIKQFGQQSKKRSIQIFFSTFALSINFGIQEIKSFAKIDKSESIRQAEELTDTVEKKNTFPANINGEKLHSLKKKYVEIMEAKHAEQKKSKKTRKLNETTADEADRLESFLSVCSHWLKQLYALDYSLRILKKNLKEETTTITKELLPLQYRLERNKPSYTIRLIKSSPKNPSPDDITLLDVINNCFKISTFNKNGKTLVDHVEVIRFLRLHSQKNQIMAFKSDALSQIAKEMYEILLENLTRIKSLAALIIKILNRTPIQDIEFAFAGINPEECRLLLRLRFQSLLPGINEDHYRLSENKSPGTRSVRTTETMEEYRHTFLKEQKKVFASLKSTLAMSYWLRKMLLSVLRNNQELKKKDVEAPIEKKLSLKERAELEKWLLVGTSLTIGEDDISIFYINPDNVISSQMSIQRVDRTDKWIAVRKSEKMHRILKDDFFAVIQLFVNKNLNPALSRFGFRPVNMQNEWLPEIYERLADKDRIEIIRSGILGTTITHLEEFQESERFHSTLERYFKKPTYNNINYPDIEKLRLVATGITHSNTSILQMKYRRVLKVKDEIDKKINNIREISKKDTSKHRKKELQTLLNMVLNMKRILKKSQHILLFAKPSLADVRLEPEEDYVVVKDFSPGE